MDERAIGEVRQQLRVLESDLAKERGQLAGLKMEEKDRKRSFRFRIIMASVSFFLWMSVYITVVALSKAVAQYGTLDDTRFRWAMLALNVCEFFFSMLFFFWFVYLLFKIWDVWKNSDSVTAQNYCTKRGKKNNSREQFLCCVRIATFEEQQRKAEKRLNVLLAEAGLKELEEEEPIF